MCAIKVHVQVVEFAGAIAVAHGIFHCSRTIVNAVDEMMLMKQRDCSKYGRFIHRFERNLQVHQTKSLRLFKHCLQT